MDMEQSGQKAADLQLLITGPRIVLDKSKTGYKSKAAKG